jgi:hypothetical protein
LIAGGGNQSLKPQASLRAWPRNDRQALSGSLQLHGVIHFSRLLCFAFVDLPGTRYPPEMNEKLAEESSLALVDELQVLLDDTLKSIHGKEVEPKVSYLLWGALHMNRLVAGYSVLRKQHMTYASKVMIRPGIETTANVVAALKQPGFLFQKGFSEYKDQKNLLLEFRRVLERDNPSTVHQEFVELERQWKQFKDYWTTVLPADLVKSKKLRFCDVLQNAGLNDWYTQYRVYCQFTHGALQASSGDLDEMTDSADNLVIVWLTLIVLDHLKIFAQVEMPNLASLWERANALKTAHQMEHGEVSTVKTTSMPGKQ